MIAENKIWFIDMENLVVGLSMYGWEFMIGFYFSLLILGWISFVDCGFLLL